MVTHEDLIEVFEDTQKFYDENETLKKSIAESISGTKIYFENESPSVGEKKFDETKISVGKYRTFETAQYYQKKFPDAKIAVLNFASATHPGGGVTNGSRAQEESLCRCSTLYPVLATDELWKKFYKFHRDNYNVRYTDACIFSPKIFVIKSDENLPQRLPEEKWISVDVLTCAAPNLRPRPSTKYTPNQGKPIQVSDEELLEIHKKRGQHILSIAAHHGAEILILGAFGCGAFKNNPNVVAKAYAEIIPEFDAFFRKIVFAVYCPPGKKENFLAFEKNLKFLDTNSKLT